MKNAKFIRVAIAAIKTERVILPCRVFCLFVVPSTLYLLLPAAYAFDQLQPK